MSNEILNGPLVRFRVERRNTSMSARYLFVSHRSLLERQTLNPTNTCHYKDPRTCLAVFVTRLRCSMPTLLLLRLSNFDKSAFKEIDSCAAPDCQDGARGVGNVPAD